MNKEPKILYFDVETSLIHVEQLVFQLKQYSNYIPYTSIKQDFTIICASWQWIGEKTIHSVSVLDNGNKDPANDRHVVQTLRDVVAEADILVYHNGDNFDLKKLNTRIMVHKLTPLPNKITSIDTYKAAKKTGQFTSNRLDYLAKLAGVGEKLETTPGLWEKALHGDPKAIKQMVVYNKQDIRIGVGVYLWMKPYIKHPNLALLRTGLCADDVCGNCEKKTMISNGRRVTATRRYLRMQCTSCGHYAQKELLDKAGK